MSKESRAASQRKYYLKNISKYRSYSRKYLLRSKYGISQEYYEILYDHQKGACKICQEFTKLLHVDHDHNTGKIRGLLCSNCNRGLGLLGDSKEVLINAIKYLNADTDHFPSS